MIAYVNYVRGPKTGCLRPAASPCRPRRKRAMNELPRTILDRIGNTSMLALRTIVPGNGCRILLKLESENPTGSMKDRMALAMVEAAEADGRLRAGGCVVQ